MALKDKFLVRLTAEQRQELEELAATGQRSAATMTRARVLLKADSAGDGRTDGRIAEALDVSAATVARVRKKFVRQGLPAAVERKRPTGRQYRKLDGAQEAHLVALACGAPPEGRARWTLRLLADKLVESEVVESIDPATVCRTLKKARSSRGSGNSGYCRRRPTPGSSRRWGTCWGSTPGPATRSGRRSASTRAASS